MYRSTTSNIKNYSFHSNVKEKSNLTYAYKIERLVKFNFFNGYIFTSFRKNL